MRRSGAHARRSPPDARGGARRSYDSQGSSSTGCSRRSRFSTDDVPNASAIEPYWVHTREDWPGFFEQLINVLALSHAFVLVNASQQTRAIHTDKEIDTAGQQEELSQYGWTGMERTANVLRQSFTA
jgi:hypothetical protein